MEPIVVNSDPTKDQIAAGIRQLLLGVASVAGALGFEHVAGKASALLAASGTIAGVIAFVWGQIKTRENAKIKAGLAAQLPDSIATTK